MKEALSAALTDPSDPSVERILAATFFRTRSRCAVQAHGPGDVVILADRRPGSSFLAINGGLRR